MDKKKLQKRAPKTERLIIENDDWQGAVSKALTKKKPKGGWPKKAKK